MIDEIYYKENQTDICEKSVSLIKYARNVGIKQINALQLITYYIIGMWIVEEQQNGEARATYNKQVLKNLSATLQAEFGKGFSVDTLENYRKFYLTYADRISEPVARNFASLKSEPLARKLIEEEPFFLPWSHYQILIRIKDAKERAFYEIEAKKALWGKRELQRQYNSSLYERLALSKDVELYICVTPRLPTS